MRKLIKYLDGYRKESIIGPLFKLLEACFELLVPLVMARIVDVGIRDKDIAYIMKMCAVMVAFGVLGLACSPDCPVLCGQGGYRVWHSP